MLCDALQKVAESRGQLPLSSALIYVRVSAVNVGKGHFKANARLYQLRDLQ